MSTIKQKNLLQTLTNNAVIEINQNKKSLIFLIRKIDKLIWELNILLINIQPEIYGRVEIFFGKDEIKFLIRQKLSDSKSSINSEFNQRYYSICKKNVLKRICKKPQYIANKNQIKPIIKDLELLINIRDDICNTKNLFNTLEKLNNIEQNIISRSTNEK